MGDASARRKKPVYRVLIPLYWARDLFKGLSRYFDLDQFEARLLDRARGSVLVVYAFMVIFFPLICYYGGVWTLTKYYLGPLFAFHLVKSLFMSEVVPVASDGREVSFNYISLPAALEWLVHGCNFQVPAYLAIRVPCYNLYKARAVLAASSFGERLKMTTAIEGMRRILFPVPLKEQYEQYARAQQYRESVEAKLQQQQQQQQQQQHQQEQQKQQKQKPQVGLGDLTTRLKPLREFEFSAKGFRELRSFLKREVNWIHAGLLLSTPLIGLYGVLTVKAHPYTWLFAVIYYFMTGIGITGGYHRLWAHRAYDATWFVRAFILCCASGAVEGSARWWCRDHRAHHRYTDTDQDPYSIKNGFFYAHMGWMLLKQDKHVIGKSDISDLDADPMLRIQHKYYFAFALFFGFILPTLVCGIGWGDYAGGYFIAAVARLVFVHHATFCVNSLAHYVGEQAYADRHTPRDHVLTALITLGEGLHSFHHEFPSDYRNGIKYYQYDPTKVVIRLMAFFGLAYNLHRFPANEISKSRYQMDAKRLAKTKKSIDWGPAPIALPLMTLEQVAAESKATPPRQLIVLDDIVYDIAEFAPNHPGGKIINIYLGRDATEAFDGGVYAHSNAARNLLDTMRVARLPTLKTNNKVIKSNNNHVGREDDESTVAETWLVEHAAYGEHGPLAHLNAARMQGTPIEKSPYEIDFPIQAASADKKSQ